MGIAVVAGVLGMCCEGWAADGDLILDVRINNGMAYRDQTWAAVDVFVDNQRSDVDGYVEVVFFSVSGEPQSPSYRVPAESPRNSTKRFRLHCLLSGCSRLEARLYHKGRPAIEFPATVQLAPIGPKDYLGLVLDDRPEDFGFLGTRLFSDQEGVRFHRMSLDTASLAALPDYLPCYTPFDIIVIGSVDPERIESTHRALLRDYVRQGGTLVVMTGGAAPRVRGSWLEDLCGVTAGDPTVFNEAMIATAAFAEKPTLQEGVSAGREGYVAALAPKTPEVKRVGNAPVLATLRPVEGGQVVMVAVDASSQLLQECRGYSALWRSLCNRKSTLLPLNFPAASSICMGQAPYVAGVNLLPIRSVITYLLTYFFIGIIGNWLFWNYRKRREMAWVCLVFISAGFTAYAMFYGTQGRARESELAQFETIRLPNPSANPANSEGEVLADLTSFIGVLAAGSGSFDAVVTRPGALVGDLASAQGQYFAPDPYSYRYRQNYAMLGSRPFAFVQSDPPLIEGLRVGASEMRFLEARSPLTLPGGITGQFQAEGTMVQGTAQNHTGLALDEAVLLYNGQFHPLFAEGEGWRLASAGTNPLPYNAQKFRQRAFDTSTRNQLSGLKDAIRTTLCTSDASRFGDPGINLGLKPCILAWVNGPPQGAIFMERAKKQTLYTTLVAAPVTVVETAPVSEQSLSVLLHQRMSGASWAPRERLNENAQDFESALTNASGAIRRGSMDIIQIHVPEWMKERPCTLLVDLWLAVDSRTAAFRAPSSKPSANLPAGDPFEAHMKKYIRVSGLFEPESSQTISTPNMRVLHLRYRIEQWANIPQPENTFQFDVDYQSNTRKPAVAGDDPAIALSLINECLVYTSAHALPLGETQPSATAQPIGDSIVWQ